MHEANQKIELSSKIAKIEFDQQELTNLTKMSSLSLGHLFVLIM